MLHRLWCKLRQPVHVGAWMSRVLRSVGRGFVRTVKAIWTALEYIIGDDTHWKVIRRLLGIAMTVLLGMAVRYGWLANAKLDWLASLFSPLLGSQYPWHTAP